MKVAFRLKFDGWIDERLSADPDRRARFSGIHCPPGAGPGFRWAFAFSVLAREDVINIAKYDRVNLEFQTK